MAERRLAAIMFTDIVGYTALMARDEEAGRRARDRHRALVRPLVERYHGEPIEARGDESLSLFPSALDAVNCALAVQEKLAGDPEKLRLHIGIHQSDIELRHGEVIGDGVNIASRVCGHSDGSAPFISDEVQHAVQNQSNLNFESLGEREFKNVPRPVPVYRVTGTARLPRPLSLRHRLSIRRPGRWLTAALAVLALIGVGVWSRYRPMEPSPIRSIAVLPLENLSGDPEQEYFSDGMTEALINEMAKLGSLRVISRTSVTRYKQSDMSLPEIARELGVDGVVEGTVIRERDRVRVTVQLIDARSDMHVWADRFDRELSGVLALQSDVALAVAEELQLELTRQEQTSLVAPARIDPDAYDAYLRGLEIWGSASRDGFRSFAPAIIEQFARAVEIDPRFAEAWARLGFMRVWFGGLGSRELVQKGKEDTQRALSLNNDLGIAHVSLCFSLWGDWDFSGARRACARALELAPNDPWAVSGYASYLMEVERKTDEALSLAARLPLIAPMDSHWRSERGRHFLYARQYERALEEFDRARELNADFVRVDEALALDALGRFGEAHRAYLAVYESCGTPCEWSIEALRRGWADRGWEGARRAWAEAAKQRSGVPPSYIAMQYARFGEIDEAFVWLERSYGEREGVISTTVRLPVFDPLRSDPRFGDLLRRIGLPEPPATSGELADVGRALARSGRSAEAIASLDQAIALSPNDPRLSRWRYYMAMARFAAGNYEQAADWAKRALEREAGNHQLAFVHLILASSRATLGRIDDARQSVSEAQRLWPGVAIEWDLWSIFTDPDVRDRYLAGLRRAGLEG